MRRAIFLCEKFVEQELTGFVILARFFWKILNLFTERRRLHNTTGQQDDAVNLSKNPAVRQEKRKGISNHAAYTRYQCKNRLNTT